jgi:hypothetical protein
MKKTTLKPRAIVFAFLASALDLSVPAMTANAGMLGDLYEIPKTSVVPTIDGVMDPVWHNVGEVFQRSYTNGTQPPDDFTDLMGWSRLMWDDNNMYVLLYTQDDIIQDVHANTWERDSWEIYFDGDDSKCDLYDNVNDLQIRLGHGVTDVANLEGQTYWVRDGVEYAVLDNPAEAPSGWLTEVKLPLAGIFVEPVANSIIGFELQQNDNDGSARESTSKWWVAEGDPSWNNASTFGEAILTDRPISEELEVPHTLTVPTIDGFREDGVWEYAAPFQINSFDNGGSPGNWPDNYTDEFGRFWIASDDANLYLFAEAWDDIIQDVHANTYERDSFEFYFDGDNSKGTSYDALNDMQLRFGHWAAANADIDGATTYFVRDNVEFAQMDTDLGWNLEIKFPVDAIQLEPVVGSEFGFEAQMNDNDDSARDAVSKWWTEVGDPSWNNASGWGTAYFSYWPFYKRNYPRTPGKINPNICSAVRDRESGGIDGFGLDAAFPNPFNPVTRILYRIPARGWTRLSIYDLMGREIAVPVEGVQPPGAHAVDFDASGLPGGVYLCKLRTLDRMEVRRMTLLK